MKKCQITEHWTFPQRTPQRKIKLNQKVAPLLSEEPQAIGKGSSKQKNPQTAATGLWQEKSCPQSWMLWLLPRFNVGAFTAEWRPWKPPCWRTTGGRKRIILVLSKSSAIEGQYGLCKKHVFKHVTSPQCVSLKQKNISRRHQSYIVA